MRVEVIMFPSETKPGLYLDDAIQYISRVEKRNVVSVTVTSHYVDRTSNVDFVTASTALILVEKKPTKKV